MCSSSAWLRENKALERRQIELRLTPGLDATSDYPNTSQARQIDTTAHAMT
jgi:hypothetical protein